jgi:ELWxxDGT repeat protein
MGHKFIFSALLLCSFTSEISLASPPRLIKDIRSGSTSSDAYGHISPVSVNGLLFFIADDGEHGEEIWQSDGTNKGTKLFMELALGSEGKEPSNLTAIGDNLFLTIKSEEIDNQSYHELLKINTLTKEVTSLKKARDTVPNLPAGTLFPGIGALHKAEDTLLFRIGDTEGNWQWHTWVTDGTVDGTKKAETEIQPHKKWFRLKDKFIFQSDRTLWESNGVDTEAVEIINEDYENIFYYVSYSEEILKINSALFFLSMGDEEDGFPQRQYHLWKYDETGISLIKELPIKPQILVEQINEHGLNFEGLINANGKMIFLADSQYVEELWVSDGTTAGTKVIKSQRGRDFNRLTNVGGTTFFKIAGSFDVPIDELWKTDGTTEGTLLVKIFEEGYYIDNFISINDTLFFTRRNSSHPDELWQSDGTEAGTKLVQSFKSIPELFNINNSLFVTTQRK